MNKEEKLFDELFNQPIPVISGDTAQQDYIRLTDPTVIFIPRKAQYNLERFVSKKLLKLVDADVNIAIEKCLIVLSQLSSTVYSTEKNKKISSIILHELTKEEHNNDYIYTKIIDILIQGTETGSFIDLIKNHSHVDGSTGTARTYRLNETYTKGLLKYHITTPYLIKRYRKNHYERLYELTDNIIAKNLLKLYTKIEIPTKEDIVSHGKSLVKAKYVTKSGKILTMRNNHINDYWKDADVRAYVEDNSNQFGYLTDNGFIMPNIGDEKSGGRVADSFNLMPSWIRMMSTIDEEEIVECDYKAMHPNIITTIYGGNIRYITHQQIADTLKIDLKMVKTEHLSFFNKTVAGMKKSPLWAYYDTYQKHMLETIVADKNINGYKITCTRAFDKEVEIMTEVIRQLNDMGIFVGYVYDAIFCKRSDREVVNEVMNNVILGFSIYTISE